MSAKTLMSVFVLNNNYFRYGLMLFMNVVQDEWNTRDAICMSKITKIAVLFLSYGRQK